MLLSMDECEVTGIIRSERIHPPSHYLMEINPYSSFASNWSQGYESGTFDAGGYKWSLVLYPLGKNKNDEYISLYLQIEETEDLPTGWEVLVNFKLFVHDQINDKYLVIQDVRDDLKRFYIAKRMWGFDELLPMEMFKDINNGYLVSDRCLFGVEVFVVQRTGRYECVRSLTTPSDQNTDKFTWKLHNFSSNTTLVRSQVFTNLDEKDIKWSFEISYVPMVSNSRNYDDDYLSLHLVSEHKDLSSGIFMCAQFTLRVVDQIDSKHIEHQASHWFCSGHENFGWEQFASVREVQRCISDNTLIIECEIHKLTVAYEEGCKS